MHLCRPVFPIGITFLPTEGLFHASYGAVLLVMNSFTFGISAKVYILPWTSGDIFPGLRILNWFFCSFSILKICSMVFCLALFLTRHLLLSLSFFFLRNVASPPPLPAALKILFYFFTGLKHFDSDKKHFEGWIKRALKPIRCEHGEKR